MKIAIVGSSGYIARQLISRFKMDFDQAEIIRVDRVGDVDVELDLGAASEADYSFLKGVDYVVFTAAISGPDACAKDFDNCWRINVTGTSFFIRKALENGAKVLFFSSDAVYGDNPDATFDENSPKAPSTPYGKMKDAVENAFAGEQGFKAIRLSYVVSPTDKFSSYCLNARAKGERIEIYHPFYRNCIFLSDVLGTVVWLLKNWDGFEHTFLNIARPELISRLRIVDELGVVLGSPLPYSLINDESFFVNRPRITRMKSLYLFENHIIDEVSFASKMKSEFKEVIHHG